MRTDASKLKLLEEASEKLSKILEIEKLLKAILTIAKKGIDADRGTIYLIDRENRELRSIVMIGKELKEIRLPLGVGLAGRVAKTGETINIEDAYKDKRFNKKIDQITGYRTKSCLCIPISDSDNNIIGVLQMLNKKSGTFNTKDTAFLLSLSYYSATALQISALHEEIVDKKRMERELELAREIQLSLFPHTGPAVSSKNLFIKGYEILGENKSCEEVSGDYYDFFPVGKSRWLFAIGDVSGKGFSSSLIMAVLQSHLKALTRSYHSIPEIVKILNEYLIENSIPERFVTLFLGILDYENHILEYVNAGHNPPILINRKGKINELKMGGPVIGMFTGLEFVQDKVSFNNGDLLFCYTDGVTECIDKKEKEFGEERLYSFLKKQQSNKLKNILTNLIIELCKHAAKKKQSDDVTILMLRRK